MKTLRLEGSAVHDIPSFYDEVNRVFMVGVDWTLGPSLDALNDLLHGGYGALHTDEAVRVVLGDDAQLRAALGVETTRRYYLAKLAEPERFDATVFTARLRALEAGDGATYYEIVREIFADHPEIDVLED